MAWVDHEFLDELAVQFAQGEFSSHEEMDKVYMDLWSGTWTFLLTEVPLAVEGMDSIEVVAELAKTRLPGWIQRYVPVKGFRNYIANHARQYLPNIYRDSRETRESRRAYDLFQKVARATSTGQMTTDAALELYVNHSGEGAATQAAVRRLLASRLDHVSLSEQCGENDNMQLEDVVAVYHEPAFEIDRRRPSAIERLPKRYMDLLHQLLEGNNTQLHQIDFGRRMSLGDKVVMLDTAFRLASQQCRTAN